MRLLKTISTLLRVKCAEDKEAFSSADQASFPLLPIKGGKLKLAPKTAVFTVNDHFRELGAFVKSDLLRSVNARSASS